ncbi:MAG: hypothetical protein LBH74_05910 [Nitrososphaerota archaeon]|uniref:hypothetical protein n=1 Tax=Candidatus Bathycorpusculum sp. TaxID=2994959 RepID=UPI002837EA16|nr:hypothetical protein [Candidatus Termitimicrobium sp.]MCL2431369.1 hypothetical protein [Candidatus Termitimicrobium sp.]MDR0493153.1 hypothetical protein [Nitrososphaerota archaeon]
MRYKVKQFSICLVDAFVYQNIQLELQEMVQVIDKRAEILIIAQLCSIDRGIAEATDVIFCM